MRFMWMAYSHFTKCLAPSVASWMGEVVFPWEGGVLFKFSLKSFVVVFISRIRSMGSWERFSRAVKARKGRGMKTGVILMALVNFLAVPGVESAPALSSLFIALSAFSPVLVVLTSGGPSVVCQRGGGLHC
jgi:hypothetical protein